MSTNTGIQWTDVTWNPIVGCDRLTAGCAQCYAVQDAWRMGHHSQLKIRAAYAGLVEKRHNGQLDWTGEVRLLPDRMQTPLHWRGHKHVFVNSMGDLFHEAIPDHWIDRVFEVMLEAPHTFQILTKRAARMQAYMQQWMQCLQPAMLASIWLGVSVENRATLGRIDHLRQTPAVIRFLSLEPLLEDLGTLDLAGISWVIIGGESGPKARPCTLAWIESLVSQCQAAGVACFVKQWGSVLAKQYGFKDRKGATASEWPIALPQEFPQEVSHGTH